MHNMNVGKFCYRLNINKFREQNICNILYEEGIFMSFSFDFDKYRKHNPRDYSDFIEDDEFDYEFSDEFIYDDEFLDEDRY